MTKTEQTDREMADQVSNQPYVFQCAWWFYLSKFIDFFDSCYAAREAIKVEKIMKCNWYLFPIPDELCHL